MNYKNCTPACLGCAYHSLDRLGTFYLSKVKDYQWISKLYQSNLSIAQ
jgi:hypothetical protein